MSRRASPFKSRRLSYCIGIDDIDPYTLEVPDIARRHGHSARVCDRRILAVRRLNRAPSGTAHRRDVRIGARRGAVER